MISDVASYLAKLAEIQSGTNDYIYVQAPIEPRIIIDANTRKMTVPSSLKCIGVERDHNAETIFLEIDRYFDNEDLDSHICVIHYVNANNSQDVYPVILKDTSVSGKLIFGWTISNHVTEKKGEVDFAIRFYTLNDDGLSFKFNFNTCISTLIVQEGLDSSLTNTKINSDLLSQAINELNDIVTTANTAKSTIDNAVLTTRMIYKAPVSSFSALSTTYPDAEEGWVSKVTGDNKIYRYTNKVWTWVDTISISTYDVLFSSFNTQLASKATKSDVQQVSLSYKESYATLALLQSTYPSGNIYNHAVLADGMIYTYKNGWVSTGIQANGTGIANSSITPCKISNIDFTNLFNLAEIKVGYVNGSGVIQDGVAGWEYATVPSNGDGNYILYFPSENYDNGNGKVSFLDQNKVLLSCISFLNVTFSYINSKKVANIPVPVETYYIAFTTKNSTGTFNESYTFVLTKNNGIKNDITTFFGACLCDTTERNNLVNFKNQFGKSLTNLYLGTGITIVKDYVLTSSGLIVSLAGWNYAIIPIDNSNNKLYLYHEILGAPYSWKAGTYGSVIQRNSVGAILGYTALSDVNGMYPSVTILTGASEVLIQIKTPSYDFTNSTYIGYIIYDTGYLTIKGSVENLDGFLFKDSVSQNKLNVIQKWASKTANFLGDSITQAVQTIEPINIAKPYHAWLKELLGLGLVRNYGIAGAKISGTNANAFCTRYSTMDDNADLIVVFGGTNDIGAILGVMGDTTNATVYGALDILCKGLIQKYLGKTIVFMTPLRRTSYNYATEKPYADAIIQVCNYYSIPVIDTFRMSGFAPDISTFVSAYMPDGLHPNDAGHELLAKRIYHNFELY